MPAALARRSQWHSAETDHELRVRDDAVPRGDGADHRVQRADHVRQQGLRGREAVAVNMSGRAADEVDEPLHLRLGMVEAPRRTPAVGAGEDGRVAVGQAHSCELLRDAVERFRPRQGNERVGPAPMGVPPRSLLQPALAEHGPGHAQVAVHHCRHGQQDGRRIGVDGQRFGGDEPAALHHGVECAPMRRMRKAAVRFARVLRSKLCRQAGPGGRISVNGTHDASCSVLRASDREQVRPPLPPARCSVPRA
jgi:hypothetical protein